MIRKAFLALGLAGLLLAVTLSVAWADGPDPFHLLKDINATTPDASPGPGVLMGGMYYFAAEDETNGEELWKSDGTLAGTVLVKDIYSGTKDSGPNYLAVMNGTLYFQADDGVNGSELWKSDGTAEGTLLVLDIYSGTTGSGPSYLTVVNDTLYFAANDGTNGIELWKSDGTAEGTLLVKDIYSGTSSSYLRNLAVMSDTLYFRAQDETNGTELWMSDGTADGTTLVKDIQPGSGSSNPGSLTVMSGALYFQANDGTNGSELWKSDGTAGGTTLVKDIWPDSTGSSPGNMTTLDGVLYFSANDGTNGTELWKSDGTQANTVMVKDIYTGTSYTQGPRYLTGMNGVLYFQAQDETHGTELWQSDGTAGGTTMVKDIRPGANGSNPGYLAALNGALYFQAWDGTNGTELWKSDGTDSGTTLVKDANPGTGSSFPSDLTAAGDRLYFKATDGTHGQELWTSDGTAGGTLMVKDINGLTGDSYPDLSNVYRMAAVVGDMYYFAADDGINGVELWKSDGTEAGTVLVKDIRPGTSDSNPSEMAVLDNVLYFQADDGTHGKELWESDGTPEGTVLVKNIYSSTLDYGSNPVELTAMGGMLYFYAGDSTHGDELWKSDGTEAGTVMVKDIYTGTSDSRVNLPTVMDGVLYFFANDGVHGGELWRSDGTAEGTVMVKDITPGSYGSRSSYTRLIEHLTVMNGAFYFGIGDDELWRSDGTEAGTIKIKDIELLQFGWDEWVVMNNAIYFEAYTDEFGFELWRSDGTEAGTQIVRDIITGTSGGSTNTNGSSPEYLTAVNNTLYFAARDGINGKELWKSDGTEAGTVMVKDVQPGQYSSLGFNHFAGMVNVNGVLYFVPDDGTHGFELWTSDGTMTGTVLVQDFTPGLNRYTGPDKLTNVNGLLYLVADDGLHGLEWWTNAPLGAGDCYPSAASGPWSVVFSHCRAGDKYVIPVTATVTLDTNVEFSGDLEVAGSLDASNCDVTFTLTGDQPQTLTGDFSFCRLTVDKTNKTDVVTIDGSLKVSKKLTIIRGKLKSASDYGDIEIQADGTLELTHDISVGGTFTNSGTFIANTYSVAFDGTTLQTLTGANPTPFYRWVISSTARVFIATTPTVTDTMENYGTISQTQTVNNATVAFLQISGDKYQAVVITTTDDLGAVSVAVSGNRAQCTVDPSSGPYRDRCFRVSLVTGSTATDMAFYTTAVEDDVDNDQVFQYQDVFGTLMWVALDTTYDGTDGGAAGVTSDALELFAGDNYFLLGDEMGDTPTAITLRELAGAGGLNLAVLALAVAIGVLGAVLAVRLRTRRS